MFINLKINIIHTEIALIIGAIFVCRNKEVRSIMREVETVGSMTEKEKLFANEWLIDFNATRSYKEAYNETNDNVAGVQGHRMLKKPKIKQYLERRIRDRIRRTEVRQDDVVNELSKVAFADPTEVVNIVTRIVIDEDGNEREIAELTYAETKNLPDDVKATIKSIKPNNRGMVEIEFHDKMKALELLGRHLGMYTDNINADVKGTAIIVDDIG